MSESKEFSTAVLVSLTSGVVFCDYSEMPAAASWILGRKVYTQDMAYPEVYRAVTKAIAANHNLPTEVEGVTPGNWRRKLAEIEAKHGRALIIEKAPSPARDDEDFEGPLTVNM